MDNAGSGIKNIGVYDDFEGEESGEMNDEGLLSPFTFLCFAVILVLFGLVMLFSASYDSALRENEAFYSIFLKQSFSLLPGFVVGVAVCFLPVRVLSRSHFVLLPAYIILFILALSLKSYTPSFLYTCVMGEVGTLSLLFLYSDLIPMILSNEKKGLSLILMVAVTVFVLLTEALLCGSGWYILTSLSLITSLFSLKVRKSYILYFCVVMLTALVLIVLTSAPLLSSFTMSAFPLSDPSYYSSSLYLSGEAIREGGVIGVGIGNGLYKLGLIEDIEGEFIYASVSEETGMTGTLIIVFSLLMILVIGVRNSNRAYKKDEKFIASMSLSSSVFISFSILFNMMFVSGIFPFEGLPLLLFSYNPVNEALTIVLLCLLYKFVYRIGREKNR